MAGQTGDVPLEGSLPAGRPLKIVPFAQLAALRPWAEEWDRLARGVPFRTWAWQSAWWRHYGAPEPPEKTQARSAGESQLASTRSDSSAALCVLGVFAPEAGLVGLLPLYRQKTWARGRALRFLASGEVCSEYLSVLCEPEWETAVANALAAWLAQANEARPDASGLRWDTLELVAVGEQDQAVARLVAALESLGHAVHRRPGPPCWRIALAGTWDDFLRPLSRNRRRKLRLLERKFVEGRVHAVAIDRREEILPAISCLIDFQRDRRRRLAQATCFDSARFVAFLHDAAIAMYDARRLALLVIEQDGSPLAVELAFRGPDRLYAYQAGINGMRLNESPGHLGTYAMVRHALEHGFEMLDLLRGDEPYKADWEARPHPTLEFRVAACRPAARLRHMLWRTAAAVKGWCRRRHSYAR